MSSTAESRLKERFGELVGLAELYILQEYRTTEKAFSSVETFDYFRKLAQQKANPAPLPEKKPPLPAPPKTILQPVVSPQVLAQAPVPEVQEKAPQTTSQTQPIPYERDLSIDALPPLNRWDLSDVQTHVSKSLPHLRIIDKIPDAKNAEKKLKTEANPKVFILSSSKNPSHLAFLNNIANALEIHGISAKVKEVHPQDLKDGSETADILEAPLLVLASEKDILSTNLSKLCRKDETKDGHELMRTPLLLLSEIERYLVDSSLKASLWNTLNERLKLDFV